MTTGERMKARRKELGLSAEDVAAALNVSRATVFRYEKGDIEKLPGSTLEPLAKVLCTTVAYLMGWDEPTGKNCLPTDAVPIDFSHLKRIPILGRIPAGLPMYAEQNIEGYTYTDLNGGADYFGLRVKGDSMDASGIRDGYVVIVRKQSVVDDGEIAVVLIDMEDATLKRFYKTGSTVTLMPQSTNPAHKPQVYDLTKTHIDILGKVVKVEFQPV